MAQIILNVLIVILIIALVALVVLYFLGNKLQKRQVEQQQLLDAAAQTASILVIDKKKMKITQAGLPKAVTYLYCGLQGCLRFCGNRTSLCIEG